MAKNSSKPAGGTYTLASGVTIAWHDPAWADPTTGTVSNVAQAADNIFLGVFGSYNGRAITDQGVTGDGTLTVGVDFGKEVPGFWHDLTTAAPAALFKLAYNNAGQATVTATAHAVLGLALMIDAVGKRAFIPVGF